MARSCKNIKSKSRVKQYGEVFTPDALVQEMLDNLEKSSWREDTCVLEPAAGNGNFVLAVLERKLNYPGNNPYRALASIYAVELLEDNVKEMKDRIRKRMSGYKNSQLIERILARNIVCGNFLEGYFDDNSNWVQK